MRPGILVLAKAPVPGEAKTRVAADVGATRAADIAAACLLDTLEAVEAYADRAGRVLAISGDLALARQRSTIERRLRGWSVLGQRGAGLGARIVYAHGDAARVWGIRPVVQIGMDTPSLTGDDLDDLVEQVTDGGRDAALGMAVDGGWWALATRSPRTVRPVGDVPMSAADTGARTLDALTACGWSVGLGGVLRDVDTYDDARTVAASTPGSRLARTVAEIEAVQVS